MANRKKVTLTSDDKKYIWHPFSQMADWLKEDPNPPLVIAKAKGNYLYDIDGKKYLDGVSSLWVTVHGHRKKEIDDALKDQINKVSHSTFLGLTHEPAIKLAKELIKIAPKGLKKVFYSDNGSTSVEIALKMAYQYWCQRGKSKKTKFLSLKNAYHGDTIGSVSVGGMDLFHSKFKSLLFDAYFVPSPYCYRCPSRKNDYTFPITAKSFGGHCKVMGCKGNCLTEVKNMLQKQQDKIAAAIIEPMVQGAAGMITFPKGYLKRFEQLCNKFNVLLICDEVATGFGRTGKMFAVEHENVSPDFLCLSKGISGGYLPLAATLTTEKIYSAFLGKYEEFKTFFHGHTYTANPLACRAAIANLEIFEKEKVLKAIKPKINHLTQELGKLKNIKWVGDIRQIGLMAGIELVKNKAKRINFNDKYKVGANVCALCRQKGLILRPLGNVIVLMPPLSISKKEISKIIETVKHSIIRFCTNIS